MPIYSLLLLAMPVPTAAPLKAPPQQPEPPRIGEIRFSRTGMVGPAIAVTVAARPSGAKALRFSRVSTGRDGAVETHLADSTACPGSAEALVEAERLPMPRPHIPVLGAGPTTVILDGAGYRLEGHAIHSDGQPGRFSVGSNVGSPLALWIDRMLEKLEPCWRPAG